jgi:hypothetical protein
VTISSTGIRCTIARTDYGLERDRSFGGITMPPIVPDRREFKSNPEESSAENIRTAMKRAGTARDQRRGSA